MTCVYVFFLSDVSGYCLYLLRGIGVIVTIRNGISIDLEGRRVPGFGS